jgi:hypothetical protein
MKKAMTLVLGFSLCLCGSLFAAEEPSPISNQYGYLSLGLGPAPLPLPQFGGGYRLQRGAHGFDANEQFSTIYYLTGVKIGLDYLYYLNPDLQKQFYIGVGPALFGVFGNRDTLLHGSLFAVAPELIFGKQYMTDTGSMRHFQVNMNCPAYCIGNHKDVLYYPLVSFSYGWGF